MLYSLVVGTSDADPDLCRDLEQWLRDEQLTDVDIHRSAVASPGEMGVLAETLSIVLSSAAAVALIESIHVWIRARRPHVSVRIRRRGGDEVVVDASSAGNAAEIVHALGIGSFEHDG